MSAARSMFVGVYRGIVVSSVTDSLAKFANALRLVAFGDRRILVDCR
jgi:hypothetical protein